MSQDKNASAPRQISFGRLMLQALPEILCFQLLSGIPLALLTMGLNRLINLVAESGGAALTTANLKDLVFSWRGPVILLLGVALVAVFAVIEIFAQIYLYDDILKGQKAPLFGEIGKGFRALGRFLCPSGILVLLYIFLAVPLCGVGFSISMTENFYIPNFIMEVVRAKPLYNIAYWALIGILLIVGVCCMFTLHGVLIDGMKPSAAYKASFWTLKANWKRMLVIVLVAALVILAIALGTSVLIRLFQSILQTDGSQLPQGLEIDPKAMIRGEADPIQWEVLAYRVSSTLVVLGESMLLYLFEMFAGAYFVMVFTRCYLEFTEAAEIRWPARPRGWGRVVRMVLLLIGLILLILALTLIYALGYNAYFDRAEPVRVVAHRTGGAMAPENSMEGIEQAIEHGCYACETDIQRTKDGYYVINHDDDFKRLTGVARKPGDMTLEEVRRLTITDPATGKTAKVPELDGMLDAVKGRVKLFIELKGATADRRMVDDVVKMVREKDCVGDVALISLKYDVIDYAETAYPEFETGMLIFGAIGDVARLNCDLLVLEEEMSTDALINDIHDAGKAVYVWTINTEAGMKKFLAGRCDGIITDQIELAQEVQKALDARTDYEVIRDGFGDLISR